MVNDYKNQGGRAAAGTGRRMMHPFGIGIIIGFVLGMGVALGFAIYINRSESPFLEKELPASRKELKPLESAKTSRSPKAPAEGAKTKFDFYEILPGKQDAMPSKPTAVPVKERVYLQAGSFHSAEDADNMKARLALQGFEAKIMTAQLPDKKTWHRVRLGPFESIEAAQQVQASLKENAVTADLIRAKE